MTLAIAGMIRYVAFLRAINVAGHARVRMSDVRQVFTAAGGLNVATHLQSGNVVFESAARNVSSVSGNAKRALEETLGERPEIMVRPMRRLAELLEQSPFAGRKADALSKFYVVFLSRRPRQAVEFPLVSPEERLEIVGIDGYEVFVISQPKKSGFFGFPNNFVESRLGVPATSRNWSTITKLVGLYPD